jgi:hypothetical protein
MVRFAAAAVAFVALLACSSAGTCWFRLAARTAHDCCEQDAAMQEAGRPCGSTAVVAAAVELAAPVTVPVVVPPVSVGAEAPGGVVFAPSEHVLDPPLVLRI